MALSAGSVPDGGAPRTLIADLRDRYRNELMSPDERLELRERILRLEAKVAETLDAQWSGLERLRP